MLKNYIFLLLIFIKPLSIDAQESREAISNPRFQEQPLDNLSIYPNPNTTGKVYITARSTGEKEIEIYDILGKKVISTLATSKEINISNLSPGVYIIKVKENEYQVTRKLIVR